MHDLPAIAHRMTAEGKRPVIANFLVVLQCCLCNQVVGAETNQVGAERAKGVESNADPRLLAARKRRRQPGHLRTCIRNIVAVVEKPEAEAVRKAARGAIQTQSVSRVVVLIGEGLEGDSAESSNQVHLVKVESIKRPP